MNSSDIFQIRSILQSAQSILLAIPKGADEDVVAASLALYLTLAKMRKQVTVVSPDEVKVEKAHLFAIDKITKQLAGGNNLVVSLPYEEGSIEKVSYHIENNRFNLVIEPRGEKLNFNPDQIQYNYGKGEYDFVLTLGVADLSSLGTLFTNHKNIFSGKPVINIDKVETNSRFGRINIISPVPVSQTVTMLIKSLRLPLDQDPASNLYTGMMSVQGNISLATADPDTLETLAYLRRANAQLLNGSSQPNKSAQQVVPAQQATTWPNDFSPVSNGVTPNAGALEETPEDWLKPKIFTTDKQPTEL
ncbi:hypothetical protein HY468_05490 [Candidatus Roizmanbacteria bacterium]|nr:hypothetical protein [Candidatus Roizmanbacteria bacterium]